MADQNEMLRVGVISSTHGIKGEVKVYPTTDDASRYKQLKRVWLATPEGDLIKELELEGIRFFKIGRAHV